MLVPMQGIFPHCWRVWLCCTKCTTSLQSEHGFLLAQIVWNSLTYLWMPLCSLTSRRRNDIRIHTIKQTAISSACCFMDLRSHQLAFVKVYINAHWSYERMLIQIKQWTTLTCFSVETVKCQFGQHCPTTAHMTLQGQVVRVTTVLWISLPQLFTE